MKKTLWIFLSSLSTVFSALHAQSIAGTWLLPQNGVQLTLSEPDARGYGQYQIQYPNGTGNQNAYLLQGSVITFAAFNYGQDQSFAITFFDGRQLGLESQNPPQSLMLQRSEAGATSSHHASGAVLASQGGYQFTQNHWMAALQFAQFTLGGQLEPADERAFQQALIEEFKANPQASLSEIEALANQMQQFYQLTDLNQIALSRSMLLAALYQSFEQQAPKTYFYTLMQKYTPLIQIDPATGLALTWQDVDGFLNLMMFYGELAGQSISFSQEDRMAYGQYLSQQFSIADPQTKASICSMAILNQYLRALYAQTPPNQRQQFAAQLLGTQQNYAGQNTSSYPQTNPNTRTAEQQIADLQLMQMQMDHNEQMFDMMNNILLEQHATSLNIIENMDDQSNTYWEVNYDDY